jgi:chemotaxis signal transduction protein
MKELVVVNLAGSKYGVWKEDTVALRDVGVVHKLPERMEWFSGVSAIDNRIAQLFDLSVCLGHSPFNNTGSGLALIMSKGDVLKGFVADRGGTTEVEDSDIFPLPAHLSCPEFDTCVFQNGELIPVIKIGKIYKRVCGPSWTLPVYTLTDTVTVKDTEKDGSLRMFTVNGKVFAINNNLIETAGVIPGHMHILPTAPGHVDGIMFENGNVRAVINTGHYMGYNGSGSQNTALFVKKGPAILVESDLGVQKAGPVIPLPSLATLELLQHAVMQEEEIIPVINVHALMSRHSKEYTGKKYVPRSKFHTFFKKKEVKVLEFSLAGMIQSIPDSQVE